jgi:hypothetical protein
MDREASLAILAVLIIGGLYLWWFHTRQKKREREFTKEVAFWRAVKGNEDPRQLEQLVRAFQPERERMFRIRALLMVPGVAACLYAHSKISLMSPYWLTRDFPFLLLLLLDDFLARRLSCPHCASVFRARDGLKPKRCRHCGISLAP